MIAKRIRDVGREREENRLAYQLNEAVTRLGIIVESVKELRSPPVVETQPSADGC